jgi:hypothetical protein
VFSPVSAPHLLPGYHRGGRTTTAIRCTG